MVNIWYVPANRDQAANSDADHFDVTREKINHQTFGGGGPHLCLGHGPARLQLRVLFEEVLTRLPDMPLAGQPTRPVSATPKRADLDAGHLER